MQTVCVISERERKELVSISDILLSVSYNFNSLTDSGNEDSCDNIEELRERMRYEMEYIEKSSHVLRSMLCGSALDVTVTDYEMSQ